MRKIIFILVLLGFFSLEILLFAEVNLFNDKLVVRVVKDGPMYSVQKRRARSSIPYKLGEVGFGSETIFSKSVQLEIFVDNMGIKYWDLRHNPKLLWKINEKDAQQYTTRILLSGLSPNEKELIFFVDRREKSDPLKLGEGDSGPLINYPNKDDKSGFFLINLTTQYIKKLNIKGNYLGWLSDENILVSDRLFTPTPRYLLLNPRTNSLSSSVKLSGKFLVLDDRPSKGILVSILDEKNRRIQFSNLNWDASILNPITGWMSMRNGAYPLYSRCEHKIYSIGMIKSDYVQKKFSYHIFANGIPSVKFKETSPFMTWDVIAPHKVAILTEDSHLLIFDIIQRKKVFETQL